MRILQVLLSPRIGGAETLASELSKAWTARSVTNAIHFLDAYTSSQRSRLTRMVRMRHAISEFKPDIILSHTALPNLYSRLASPHGVSNVTVLHSSAKDFGSAKLRISEKLLTRRTRHVVGVGAQQITEYQHHFGTRIPTSIIPNGVRADLPSRLMATIEPQVVLTLARIANVKNPWLWAETANAMSAAYPGIEINWWGPAQTEEMKDLVLDHKASKRAGNFQGPSHRPNDQLATADILFHPSDRESNGLSIVEAACVGLPVVCSDVVASVLPPELPLSTFEAGNPVSAAQALDDVICNYGAHAQASIANAGWVRELFGMEHCATLYLELFESIAAP